jgi:tetratricopeptide (TPR) repeat protein
MAFCIRCGTKLPEGAKFCANCGTQAAVTSVPAGKTADDWMNEGIAFYNQENYEESERCFTEAIKLDPDGCGYYNNRGITFYKRKDYTAAIADFTRAIERKPDLASGYANRGESYALMGNTINAVRDYEKALSLDSGRADWKTELEKLQTTSASAMSSLPEVCPNCGTKTEGAKFCANCGTPIAAAPVPSGKSAKDWRNEGRIFYNQKDYAESERCFTEAIKLDPNGAVHYVDRGRAYAALKENKKALNDYNKAIELKEYPPAYNYRGDMYKNLKDYSKALADYSKAIELNPEKAKDYFYTNRGQVYLELFEDEKALEDFSKALELKKDYANYFWRGYAFYKMMDRPKEAIADFEKALELEPDNAEAREWLVDAKKTSGGTAKNC